MALIALPQNRGILTPRLNAARFRQRLIVALGGDVRLLWMPMPGDTTPVKSYETQTGQVGTPGASVASQISQLGRGNQQSFASASSQYISFPDTSSLTFGNGTADQAFSVVALVNVTDTAVNRNIISRWNGTGTLREWQLVVTSADLLNMGLFDESVDINPTRQSDAVITQGAWKLFGATYDGTGGATAANGITLYQDGAVIASTATNNASYVAMEDLSLPTEIGSQNAHAAAFFDGSMAFVAVCAGARTAAQMTGILTLVRRFYGVP